MSKMRVFAGLFLAALCGAQSQTEITFPGLSHSNPGATFDHGYVVARDLMQVHNITVYSPNGQKMFDLSSLTLPDGTKTTTPLSVAIDSDGVSALTYSVEGDPRSGFAILDNTGAQLRVIQTEPYRPSQVCFAPDHSIWMFGDHFHAGHDVPMPDFMTFRHYTRDGQLLGSYIPRSSLPAWEGKGLDQLVAPFVGLWRLRATKDRIGAALRVGPFKEAWVELDFDGKLLGQWTYLSSTEEGVFPIAFDSTGLLYGRHWLNGSNVGVSIFDKSTSTWRPVPDLPNGRVLGADGTRLVYQDGDQLRWIQAVNMEPVESATVSLKAAPPL